MQKPEDARSADIAKLDQAFMLLADMIPPLIWNLFDKFKKEGFSEAQAFDLARSYLIAFVSNKGSS